MLPILLSIANAEPVQASGTPRPTATATAASQPSLFDVVAQKMSPPGRPIFQRYINQQFVPQLRADQQAEIQYRQQLHAIVQAPTLDLEAATRLIDARKRAADAAATAIRTSAFAMLRALPVSDRKLGLTAIFADARLPAAAAKAAAPRAK